MNCCPYLNQDDKAPTLKRAIEITIRKSVFRHRGNLTHAGAELRLDVRSVRRYVDILGMRQTVDMLRQLTDEDPTPGDPAL